MKKPSDTIKSIHTRPTEILEQSRRPGVYRCYCRETFVKGRRAFHVSGGIEHRVDGCLLFKGSREGIRATTVAIVDRVKTDGRTEVQYYAESGGIYNNGLPLSALGLEIKDGEMYQVTVKKVNR